MSDGSVSYESADGIAVLRINRPAKRNAFTARMCEDLREGYLRFGASDDRAAVLCAEGTNFTAGADLNNPPEQFWRAIPGVGLELEKPVVAAVHGTVVGLGVTMVAFADLCVAADNTQFIYPEARVGVSKGLIAGLVARIPHKIAMELLLTGEPMGAQRAYEAGLVNRIAPAGQHVDAAKALARTLAANAPMVMGLIKHLVAETLPKGPVEQYYRTGARTLAVSESEDAKEGQRAFAERRPPLYRGK